MEYHIENKYFVTTLHFISYFLKLLLIADLLFFIVRDIFRRVLIEMSLDE